MKTAVKPEPVRSPAFSYRLHSNSRPRLSSHAQLFCESVSLERLAERHGTPLYVYSAEMIRARIEAFQRAFRSVPYTLCYSVKANSTLGILRLIARQGAGFDVVSGGELERVLRVKPRAARSVVFSGVGKTVPEMELALKAGDRASELSNGTHTLNPGIYNSIQASGNANLTLNPGVYILEGGGLAVSGNAGIGGTGVTLYNTSSSTGSYGAITLSGSGTFALSAPDQRALRRCCHLPGSREHSVAHL